MERFVPQRRDVHALEWHCPTGVSEEVVNSFHVLVVVLVELLSHSAA